MMSSRPDTSPNFGAVSPISTASSRRALASVALKRSRSAFTRADATSARPVSAGDEAPASTRRCSSGVSLSMAAICSSSICIRRCAPSTLRKAIAVSDSTSSRTALRWIAATSMPASPAAIRASRLPNSSKAWLICSVVSADLRAAIYAGPERIVLFIAQLRIEQRAGLDALARGDADIALRRRQPRAGGQRARERARIVRVWA